MLRQGLNSLSDDNIDVISILFHYFARKQENKICQVCIEKATHNVMCVAFAAFLLLLACLVIVGPVSPGSQQDPVKRCMRSLEQFRQELICILDRDTRVLLDQVAVSKVDRISFAECIPSQPQQILRYRYTEPHADKERNKHLQGYIFCTPCIVIKLLDSGQSGLIQQAFFA